MSEYIEDLRSRLAKAEQREAAGHAEAKASGYYTARHGHSFAVAGLLRQELRDAEAKAA